MTAFGPRIATASPDRLAALALAALLVAGLGAPRPAAAQDQSEIWAHVAAVRAGLAEASPLTTDFVQSYTPSGFSVADEESGTLAMNLPPAGEATSECVRWDYDEPFPKGFLLCDRIAWAWNPGEASGRRQLLGRADSFGLDLLRLSVDQLRSSYEATVVSSQPDRLEVQLVPNGPAAAEIRDASLELDPAAARLLALSYHDVEGNLTRFALGAYRTAPEPQTLFTPPADLEWLEE
jgi:hypothetical protein